MGVDHVLVLVLNRRVFIGAALIHEGDDDSIINSNREAKNNIVREGKWAVGASRIDEEFNIECWGLVDSKRRRKFSQGINYKLKAMSH